MNSNILLSGWGGGKKEYLWQSLLVWNLWMVLYASRVRCKSGWRFPMGRAKWQLMALSNIASCLFVHGGPVAQWLECATTRLSGRGFESHWGHLESWQFPLPLLYLLTPVYSLGAWAIDQSSPPDPALRHGCNFLPGVPHLHRFRLHVSPPGVSWPSSFLGDSMSGLVLWC